MERLGTTQTEDVRVPPFEKGGLGGISTDRLSDAEKELNDGINNAFRRFEEAMDDDLNTSGAIGAIFELVASANKFVAEHEEFSVQGKAVLGRVRSALIELCQILGIQMDREAIPAEDKSLVSDLIKLIIEIREDARERKDWAAADKIRDGLADLDIKLEDTAEGTIWKMER
jgi:cysteinyl-tRNA synthetase